jgi:hypothetical protein
LPPNFGQFESRSENPSRLVDVGFLVPFTVFGGGTLVMDEHWNAGLLATYPEIIKEDPPAAEGVRQAWRRSRERFDRIHGSAIQKTVAARDEKRSINDPPVIPGCPFVIQRSELGAYRLVRRTCCLHDQALKGIGSTQHGLVQQ